MKLICALLVIIIFPLLVHGQELIFLTALQDSIKETSGLIYLNQKLTPIMIQEENLRYMK